MYSLEIEREQKFSLEEETGPCFLISQVWNSSNMLIVSNDIAVIYQAFEALHLPGKLGHDPC